MTVSAQTPVNRSTGNGVTTVFPYQFKIISSADIEVTVDDVVQTLNVDYTVSGAGVDAGGNVTMTTAPANLTTVVRRRNMALVRTTDYQDQGTLPAATLDSDIDATVLMVQQLDERLDRTFSLPASFSGDSTLPAPQAGYLLGWDATAENLTNIPATIGTSLVDLAASSGSSLVGFIQSGAGAVAATVQARLRESVSVKDFGALGDGITDDTVSIQNAINFISPTAFAAGVGGGIVFFPGGKYRITSGLIVGGGCRLVGTGSGGFPYHGANSKHSIIQADFGSNVNQWIIDSATYNKPAGTRVAYNAFVGPDLNVSYTPTYQVGIEGLHITCTDSTTNIIYGGVRLIGCPASKISDVTVIGCGIALQLNTSFVSEVSRWHSETHYYGLVLYESNNACKVDGYFNKIIEPSDKVIPPERVLSIFPSASDMSGTLEINASHYGSAKGVVVMAPGGSSSQTAELSITAEYWADTIFLFNSYSTVFSKLYTESPKVNFIVSGANCSAVIQSMSTYSVNAKGFDVGYGCNIDATIQGLFVVNNLFGNVSDNLNAGNNAYVKLRGISAKTNPQHGRVSYEKEAKPTAYVSFDGADLSIKNSYNLIEVSRVSGEVIGDYWIDYRVPSNNEDVNGEPVVSITLGSGVGFGTIWASATDGIQNGRIRVRCMDFAGTPFDPPRVMLVFFG